MSTIQSITVRDFIGKYQQDENVFKDIPEFSFIKPVAAKVKQQNCFCGLGEQMNRATLTFNDIVNDLSEETINKIRVLFQTETVCFGIQVQGGFSTRCY